MQIIVSISYFFRGDVHSPFKKKLMDFDVLGKKFRKF